MAVAVLLLRVAVFGTFLGHGILAMMSHAPWIPYLEFWGLNKDQAGIIMPVIGAIDLLIAIITLFKPIRIVLIYAVVWAFLTALMRPVVGESWLAFVERAANWGAPAALYALLYLKARSSTS